MFGKLGILLLFFQLWSCALANQTVSKLLQLDAQVTPTDVVANTSSFPYQIGKKVYHFETDVKVNWYQAKNNCRKLGGHLLNIESSQEMDAILAVAPSSRYWTSANCLAELNEWISDSTGELMPYLRWRAGEPNNAYDSEFCLEIVYKNGLNDLSPKGLRNYICEAKFT